MYLMKNQYVFSMLTKVINVILGTLTSVFINRYLGPTLKGEYAFMLNIINIIVLVLNLGIYQSYPFFKKSKEYNLKQKFYNIVLFQFILYLFIAIFLSIIVNTKTNIVFIVPPIMILANQLSFIMLVEDVNKRNIINLCNQLLYTSILFLLFYFAPVNISFVLFALLINYVVIIFSVIKSINLKININNFDSVLLKKSIRFGIFPMLTSLLITANYSIDVIILKMFVDYKMIGLYTVGIGLANQVWIIPDAFKDVLFSKTARDDAVNDVKISIKINLYISLILILGIILFGKSILTFLYGKEFLDAYKVTVIIFIGLIPMIFFKLINPLFISLGKQKESFFILLASAIVNIIANFILIPTYNISGAAISSVLSYMFCGLIFIYIFMRRYSIGFGDIFLLNKAEISRIRNLFQRR